MISTDFHNTIYFFIDLSILAIGILATINRFLRMRERDEKITSTYLPYLLLGLSNRDVGCRWW